MEVSQVRKRLKSAIDAARSHAQHRREQATAAERAYETFLQDVAIPIARQVANALKAEGYAFTISTPGGGLRLGSERTRDDFVDIALDTSGDRPQVIGRVSATRGSRVLDEERVVKPGAAPDAISEDDFLDFLLHALEPWLER